MIRITGKRALTVGLTVLIVLLVSGYVVQQRRYQKVLRQLNQFIVDMNVDVRIKTIGKLIVLDGEVTTRSQLERIGKMLAGLSKAEPAITIQNLVVVCAKTWVTIAERIEREIGSPEISARLINQSLYLEGTTESDFEADRAVEVARSYLSSTTEPLQSTGAASMTSSGAFRIVDMIHLRAPSSRKVPVPRRGKLD